MAIDVYEITDEQLNQILSYTENHFLDLKAKEIKPSDLTKTISAFANADGGELYIGIAESGVAGTLHRWDGFADPEDGNAHLQVFENLFPLGEDYSYNFLVHPRQPGVVLQVTVRKSRMVVNANDGIPRLRRGAQNLRVDTPEAQRTLERNKGITSFEDEPVSTDLTRITNSETVIRFILDVVPTQEPEVWLRKHELIKGDKPTVAGVVLFADFPQALLPKRTGIKIYRYKTAQEEGTRDTLVGNPVTVEGSAYDLIREAERITQEIISGIHILGARGLEQVHYPTETLHEVITNAVLHRDYYIADDVHIRIFDNRVEVASPGRLPAHITPSNILKERFSRNGHIVSVINKFPDPPNKDVGEGLTTAFEAMRSLRLKDPEIVESGSYVVVHIRHEKLASAEQIVMEYLENHEEITNIVARELTGIKSENTMKDVFVRLRERSKIELVPGRSNFKAAWRKIKNGASGGETAS
jgi:ATP-dependent DNA helicase RecG